MSRYEVVTYGRMMSDPRPEQTEIDVHNNAESRAAAADAIQRVARASDGGAPPREAPPAGELPEENTAGTATGNPVEGLEIRPEDRVDAKVPDQDAMDVDGPTAGHA